MIIRQAEKPAEPVRLSGCASTATEARNPGRPYKSGIKQKLILLHIGA
jgi:hypothetical protein